MAGESRPGRAWHLRQGITRGQIRHHMSTARRYWLVATVILIFLTALGISVQILVASAFEAQRSQKNIAWAAAQLQIEFLQINHSLVGYTASDRTVPAAAVATRLSIFKNRIRVLKQETDQSDLADDPIYAQLVVDLESAVAPDSPVTR